MKKILKNNFIAITIFIIMSIYIVFSCYGAIKDQNQMNINRSNSIEFCQNEMNSGNEEILQYCNKLISEKDIKVDFYTVLSDILLYRVHFLNGIAFLLVCIPTLFYLSKMSKSKYLINYLLRDNYKNYMKMYLKESYKYIWLLPIISILIIIPCFILYSKDPTYSQMFGTSIWTSNIVSHPLLFIALYLFNIILYSFIFVNIALIVIRKCHNYFSAVLLSFLSYLGIELFFEVVINLFISQFMCNQNFGRIFNIMNLFTFSDQYGTVPLLLFTITIFIISSFGVYISYKNKEKFIIDCEKEKK